MKRRTILTSILATLGLPALCRGATPTPDFTSTLRIEDLERKEYWTRELDLEAMTSAEDPVEASSRAMAEMGVDINTAAKALMESGAHDIRVLWVNIQDPEFNPEGKIGNFRVYGLRRKGAKTS